MECGSRTIKCKPPSNACKIAQCVRVRVSAGPCAQDIVGTASRNALYDRHAAKRGHLARRETFYDDPIARVRM